jgi:hypothetical protein
MRENALYTARGLRRKWGYSLVLLTFLTMGCVAQDNSPDGIIKRRCSRCHTLGQVYATRKDAAGWHRTVEKMACYASGVIPDKEIPVIVAYLALTQGIAGKEKTISSLPTP